MRLRVVPFVQHGKTMYVGKISAGELLGSAKADVWTSNSEGYQRAAEPMRSKAFMRFVTDEVSPPAILANIRDTDAKKVSEKDGFLHIPDGVTLWLVDGQHRFAGIGMLDERLHDLEFPIVIMVGGSVYDEAMQFVLVNAFQKKIRTDLGEIFLQRAGRMGAADMPHRASLRDIEWIPTAIGVSDLLARDSNSVWYGKIKLPNRPKEMTTVNQKSFIDSLKPVISPGGQLAGRPAAEVYEMLKGYWRSVRMLCPQAFDQPQNYVIQKTTGVSVLHWILERIMRKTGSGNLEAKAYDILGRCPSVNACEMWLKTGKFGVMSGQRGVSAIREELLDEVIVAMHGSEEMPRN